MREEEGLCYLGNGKVGKMVEKNGHGCMSRRVLRGCSEDFFCLCMRFGTEESPTVVQHTRNLSAGEL